MPHPRQPNIAMELALLLVLSTLWGASYTFIKIAVKTIPPVTFMAARTLIAGALPALVLHPAGCACRDTQARGGTSLLQAVLNSAVPFTLIAWAEQTVDAGARDDPELDHADLHLSDDGADYAA